MKNNSRLQEEELYVQADENAKYGVVLRVMAAARSAGAEKLGMITDPMVVKVEPDAVCRVPTPSYTSDEGPRGRHRPRAASSSSAPSFTGRSCRARAIREEEKPLISRPVVQASLLKLGKPIDPKKLPDRLVPQTRTAPKKQITASREDPGQGEARTPA